MGLFSFADTSISAEVNRSCVMQRYVYRSMVSVAVTTSQPLRGLRKLTDMSVSRRAQTGRNKYVRCMHVVIATTRCLQPVDAVCPFSGPSTPRFGSPLKCKPFAFVQKQHQVMCVISLMALMI